MLGLGITNTVVIEHEEAGTGPILCVKVVVGLRELFPVVIVGHEESSIISINVASFLFGCIGPQVARIRPVPDEPLISPWVLHMDESSAVRKHDVAEHVVGVALDNAIRVRISIATCWGSRHEDVALVGVFRKLSPVSGLRFVVGRMISDVLGVVAHCAGGSSGVSTFDMLVVSMVLGKGLLNDGNPEGTFITSILVITKTSEVGVAVGVKGEEVVDDDGVGHAESVEVYSVDAVGADRIRAVEEHFLDRAWDLCHGSARGEEPAVAKRSLLDIVGLNSIGTEEGVVGEGLAGSSPGDIASF